MKTQRTPLYKKLLAFFCCAAVALSTMVAPVAAQQPPEAVTLIPQSEISIESFYSQHTSTPIGNILDGKKNTMWENDYSLGNVTLPETMFTLDLGQVRSDVCQVVYTPRQSDVNGKVTKYKILAGETTESMQVVAGGYWDYASGGNISDKTATFSSTSARYVALYVMDVTRNVPTTTTVTCAEFNVGTAAGYVVEQNRLANTITGAEEMMEAMPEGILKTNLLAAVNTAKELVAEMGILSLKDLNSQVAAIETAMTGEGLVPGISVAYTPRAHSSTPPRLMLDGNINTFFETNWSGSAVYKSGDYIVIDLGDEYPNISQIVYTPRQNSANGRIVQHNVYVSTEDLSGLTFTGTQQQLDEHFTFVGKGGWDPSQTAVQTATFLSQPARYVVLQAMNTGGDANTITCAEIGVRYKEVAEIDSLPLQTAVQQMETLIPSLENELVKQKVQAELDAIDKNYTSYTQEGIYYYAAKLQEACELYSGVGNVSSIKNGPTWLDTDGVPIQAHGGGIIYNEQNQTYYWYGEDKTEDNLVISGGTQCVPITGVHCYSSKDLYNWKNEGVALPVFNNPQFADGTQADDSLPLYVSEQSGTYQNSPLQEYAEWAAANPGIVPDNGTTKPPTHTLDKHNSAERIEELNSLYKGYTYEQKREMYLDFNWNKVVERPKVIYNENTGKYVMWWHHDGDKAGTYWVAEGGVAISDSPTGPFKYLSTERLPNTYPGVSNQGMLRDMTLYVDNDQTGYLIYSSEENRTTIMMKLNDEYTAPATDENGSCVEGIHWKRIHADNREAPTVFEQDGVYYMVTSGLTGWSPNPAKYHVSENGLMGDWIDKGDPCIDDTGRNTFQSQSTYVLPYRDPDGNVVPGKFIFMADRWIPRDLKDSRYIWLPIELDTENKTLAIRWWEEWSLEDVLNPYVSLAVEGYPSQIPVGSTLNLSGATAYLERESGYRVPMDVGAVTVGDFDNTTPGTVSVPLTYEGEEGTFTCTIELEIVAAVDKTALQALYNECLAVENDNYTEGSWQAFQNALSAAEAVLENESATQQQVDDAKEQLQTAYDELTKQTEPEVPVESVKINLGALTNLKYGKPLPLNVSINPENATDKTLVFTSSNNNVLTVDTNGVVTGVKPGTARVTATAHNGISHTVTIRVTA